MNSAGVSAIVGGYASGICLAPPRPRRATNCPTSSTSALPMPSSPRPEEHIPFRPGFGVITKTALANLIAINDKAGKPAKTVMIVHEDSAFGAGLAKLLNTQLPANGFEFWKPSRIRPDARFNNVVLRSRRPARTSSFRPTTTTSMCCSPYYAAAEGSPKAAIYSVLGGAASSYKFVKEFQDAAQYIMDCNHWFDPRNPKALELKKRSRRRSVLHLRGLPTTAASCCSLTRSSVPSRRTRRNHRPLTSSTFAGHVMPTALPNSSTARTRRGAGQYPDHRR